MFIFRRKMSLRRRHLGHSQKVKEEEEDSASQVGASDGGSNYGVWTRQGKKLCSSYALSKAATLTHTSNYSDYLGPGS